MEDLVNDFNPDQYMPAIIDGAINVLFAVIILLIGMYIANKANQLIRKTGHKYNTLDDTVVRFFGSVAKYTILAFVVIAVLNRFGVQTASIVAVLGATGLAIGLALQGALTNLAAGVMLLMFRPYKVGDFIDAAGRFGNVTEIDLFTTVLKTFDNQHVIIPNSQIWGSQIINHSHYDIRGVDMTFGVAYKENTDEVRKVIMGVLSNHPHILKDPAPFLEVSTLNDSSVDFIVRPFCQGEHYFDVLFSVPEQVKKALDEAGIEIPFPHRKVILSKEE